jgi:hypothetical protein
VRRARVGVFRAVRSLGTGGQLVSGAFSRSKDSYHQIGQHPGL